MSALGAAETLATRSQGCAVHRGSLVVVTSYEIAMRDRQWLYRSPMRGAPWRAMVVDEGHRLKNFKCKLVDELKKFSVDFRLLLSGTPLQNSLGELWSLLNFVMPAVFGDMNFFEQQFDLRNESLGGGGGGAGAGAGAGADANAVIDAAAVRRRQASGRVLEKLNQILGPFMFRRLKRDVATDLPAKHELVVYCGTTPAQRWLFKQIAARTLSATLAAEQKRTGAHHGGQSFNNLLMQLRKACLHPYLFHEQRTGAAGATGRATRPRRSCASRARCGSLTGS
jgi:ATP-dependent DNA helicase